MQPRNLGPTDWFYHLTNVNRDLDGADPDCVMKMLIYEPTPGKPSPATSDGTRNNAKLYLFSDNIVTSYVTFAMGSGMPIVVNTAGIGDGSAFGPGYVARYIQSGRIYTKGEGSSKLQSIGILSYLANEFIWGLDLERIIKKCKC